jgi:hypothetical protein
MEAKAFGLLCGGITISGISLFALLMWWVWSGFDGGIEWEITETFFVIFLIAGIILTIAGVNVELKAWTEENQRQKPIHTPCPYCGKELAYDPQDFRYFCIYCKRIFRDKRT